LGDSALRDALAAAALKASLAARAVSRQQAQASGVQQQQLGQISAGEQVHMLCSDVVKKNRCARALTFLKILNFCCLGSSRRPMSPAHPPPCCNTHTHTHTHTHEQQKTKEPRAPPALLQPSAEILTKFMTMPPCLPRAEEAAAVQIQE
jgi:hypothetical protein